MNIHPETLYFAELLDLLCGEKELSEVPVVLSHGPEDLAGVDVTFVPLQELLGCSYVPGDGLLGENMLASEQRFPDEFRLHQNGKTIKVVG